jgi:hypothetical protein
MVPFIPNEVRQDKASLDIIDQDVLIPTLQDALAPKEDQDLPPFSMASSQPHGVPHILYNSDVPQS